MSSALQEAETRASHAIKSSEGMESQLSDALGNLEEETRQKLSINSKLRALETEKEHMLEQLEEE